MVDETSTKAGGKTKGPDNNKELARLVGEEAKLNAFFAGIDVDLSKFNGSPVDAVIARCVSLAEGHGAIEQGLSETLFAAGITLEAGQDPIEQSKAVIGRWHELTLARAELAVAVAAAVGVPLEEITDPIKAAEGALETMLAKLKEVPGNEEADHETLTGQVAALGAHLIANYPGVVAGSSDGVCACAISLLDAETNRANAAENALDHAELVAQVRFGDVPSVLAPADRTEDNARACGPDAPAVDREDLDRVIQQDADLELVFSDGEKEIVSFEPKVLTGRDFRRIPDGRYLLGKPIVIRGVQGRQENVHGADLFVNGEHAAYCPLERPLAISPGDERQFSGQLSF